MPVSLFHQNRHPQDRPDSQNSQGQNDQQNDAGRDTGAEEFSGGELFRFIGHGIGGRPD